MASAAVEWIDLLLSRSAELRRAGVLSIGFDGYSAVLAPAEPEGDDAKTEPTEPAEPSNHWENPGSYPTGNVPTLERDRGELPPIPSFEDG